MERKSTKTGIEHEGQGDRCLGCCKPLRAELGWINPQKWSEKSVLL